MKDEFGKTTNGAKTVEMDARTVKQMLNLYRAIQTAESTYRVGSLMYKNRIDLIENTAKARNVKTAFEEAAAAVGEKL